MRIYNLHSPSNSEKKKLLLFLTTGFEKLQRHDGTIWDQNIFFKFTRDKRVLTDGLEENDGIFVFSLEERIIDTT